LLFSVAAGLRAQSVRLDRIIYTHKAARPGAEFRGDVTMNFSATSFLSWPQGMIGDKYCRLSPTIKSPPGYEMNHHRVTINFTGVGSVQLSVLHSTKNDLNEAANKEYLHSRFRPVESGREITVASGERAERFAWLAVQTIDQVKVDGIRHVSWKGKNTLYGHSPGTFEFAGAVLPYRLMYPGDYDRRKSYPLVLSVSGSGGVGSDNIRSMEKIILARYLFLNYFYDQRFECFSLVPQIPPKNAIPHPYWPKGDLGKPTPPYHPGCPVVNEQGWYVQATIALINELAKDDRINIDKNRIYYSGFSYGGKGCWEFLKAAPNLFAAAMCGAGWPIGPPYSDPSTSPQLLTRLKLEVQRYKHVPIHIFAGEQDAMRFGSRAVHAELLTQGADSTYIEFPETSHVGAAAKAWGNRAYIKWLFAQNRSNTQDSPDVTLRDSRNEKTN